MHNWIRSLFALAAMAVSPTAGGAQDVGAQLMADPAVKAALAFVERNEARIIDEQARICEVPAPPFKEQARAEAMRALFVANGLGNVRIDAAGNVIGERPGHAPSPNVVFSAHLDTVFPEGTDVRVTRQGTVLRGAGIGDDCRGLAVLLGVIQALKDARIQTPGTITFVATVGEEGLGDLRGVKHLFGQELKGRIDKFVSVDGTGLGITHVGVGSHRYRVTVSGPGGHSYGAFGLANPIHALGRAIATIADFTVPSSPKTTFNVGRIGGGTSVNSIAYEAWMEVDMRSADAAALADVDARFQRAVDDAVAAENRRWNDKGRLTVKKDLVGDRAAGSTPPDSAIVQAAVAATRALSLPVSLDPGSTDSNVPMGLGVPAVTIDGGGTGRGAHSLDESFDSTDSWKGTARALLFALAIARD
ncbi:MAG TPA: M20/M25/M40 family metallo-hydrolase [Vicinamibacterales bacterium]|nr:M20/M25/M40 family metallo-hydrolase [Vicinamibacterales bacterium]